MSSADDPIELGKVVYNRIMVSGSIPNNMIYIVTDCTAMDDNKNPTADYDLIKVSHR